MKREWQKGSLERRNADWLSSLLVLLLGYVVAFTITLYFPLVAPVAALIKAQV